MSSWLVAYWHGNLASALRTWPCQNWRVTLACAGLFSIAGGVIGFASGLFKPGFVCTTSFFYLPITLFIFPSFLEEFVFRGCLIPRDTLDKGVEIILMRVSISVALFTLWHPLNALTINPGARAFFLNPSFVSIVALLGVASSLCYIYSRSLWTPVLLHWMTVLVWVLFLGGRNLVLEAATRNGF